ncbi:MAG: DUF2334 domain-containing protein [Candidatus Pacearchaeota archaeon]
MNKTKTWFSVLILVILVLIILAPLTIKPWIEGKELVVKGVTVFKGPSEKSEISSLTIYENPEHNSCFVSIPQRSIIIRMDDIRVFSKPSKRVIDEILAENISITLGVIPRQLEDDPSFAKYIISIKDNPRVEIAQHGVYHNETDKYLTEDNILSGMNKIQSILNVRPVTYSAPFNDLAPESERILAKYFKGITGEWGVIKEGNIAQLGHTVSNYALSQNSNKSILDMVDVCAESLDRTNYCVVLLHPQEFATDMKNASEVDEEKIQELKEFIRELKKLDAEFINFKDIISCTEGNVSQNFNYTSSNTSKTPTIEIYNISKHEFIDEFNMTEN